MKVPFPPSSFVFAGVNNVEMEWDGKEGEGAGGEGERQRVPSGFLDISR